MHGGLTRNKKYEMRNYTIRRCILYHNLFDNAIVMKNIFHWRFLAQLFRVMHHQTRIYETTFSFPSLDFFYLRDSHPQLQKRFHR